MALVDRSPLYLAIIAPHAAVATAALAAGFVALAVRKGRGLHTRAGRVYAWAIVGVAASGAALMLAGAWSVRLLVLLGLTSTITWSGLRVLKRRRPDVRPADRATAADWAVAAAGLGVGVGACAARLAGLEPRAAAQIWSTAPFLAVISAYDLWRFARPAGWPMRPTLWLREHVAKSVGAFFGAVSAFSGAVLTAVPDPWRVLVPNVLGVLVTVYFLRRLRRGALPGAAPARIVGRAARPRAA